MTDKKTSIKVNYILNAPILTDWGIYEFFEYNPESLSLDLKNAKSAIGHKSTALFLSRILGIKIKYNRVRINMKLNDVALVFQLKERPAEGKIFSEEELKNSEYILGILRRIK